MFLVGLEEGLFPGSRSMGDPSELEEERRLCYVAITRAKESLDISYARQRMLYGRTTTNVPSRFVEELPESCVEKTVSESLTAVRGQYQTYRQQERPSIYGDFGIPQESRPSKPMRDHSALMPGSQNKGPKVHYSKGDMVLHNAFGRGMVLTVLPMGNDALLEIAFDGVGTKRLMANTASVHMKKL